MTRQPLAERMRPQTLADYLGQAPLVSDTGLISNMIKNDLVPSVILYGPPGTGKTTLAQLIASHSKRPFYSLSAINAGVKEVRSVIDKAKEQTLFSIQKPILFIDEIHRFNKTQQDSLLEAVEKARIILIGATTENPSFELVPALLSRCQVYTLQPFTEEGMLALLQRAITQDEFLMTKKIDLQETEALMRFAGGDARKLLNGLELVVNNKKDADEIVITNDSVLAVIQQNMALYDKGGDQHYDIASALIKSIRGSDPNAAVYWLARMIAGGEEVTFIARRLIISASEDIGNANPTALIMAQTTFQAVKNIGYPEARIILSQCAVYLATSPKSNASYKAINQAQKLVKQSGDLLVPLHLRNAPTQWMKSQGYGEAYQYVHDSPNHFIDQEYMPQTLENNKLYEPATNTREEQIRNFLQQRWKDKYGY